MFDILEDLHQDETGIEAIDDALMMYSGMSGGSGGCAHRVIIKIKHLFARGFDEES